MFKIFLSFKYLDISSPGATFLSLVFIIYIIAKLCGKCHPCKKHALFLNVVYLIVDISAAVKEKISVIFLIGKKTSIMPEENISIVCIQ